MRRIVVTVVGVLAAAWVVLPRLAPAASSEFYKGLGERGLQTLMDAYLKQQRQAVEVEPGEKKAGPPAHKKIELADLIVQQAREAKKMSARERAFRQAKQLYEQAIQVRKKAYETAPADQLTKQNEALFHLIQARLALANMIFQDWLKTNLDLLEISQRQGGDREGAVKLLRLANDAYADVTNACESWLTNLAMLPGDDYSQFTNLGKRRKVRNAEKQARYFGAWGQYYYAWLLPEAYKPPEGRRTRKEILSDAITAFMPFADDERDSNANKWYARLGIAMAYRELGEYEKAIQQLAMVAPPPVRQDASRDQSWKVAVRIRAAYEKALTHVRMGKFSHARKTLEEARTTFGDALQQTLYGQALPIVEAVSYVEEAEKQGQENLRNKGVDLLKGLHGRPNPWPMVVQWVMSGLLGRMPEAQKDPFQLWLEANDRLARAQQTESPDQMRQAAALFKAYADKVGPENEKYPAALYRGAAALLQVGGKAEAARLFRQVAEQFPDYRYAEAAAGYAVGACGEVYENAKTEKNRQAYEETLEWFVENWLQTDPEQQYYYALVLYRGEKYLEAADAFARVSSGDEHYPDSRYWVALCRLEHFRAHVLASGNKQEILSGARDVAEGLLDFAKYAFRAQKADLPEQKKRQLLDWARFAYLNAAEVYLYNEVALPADAMPILKETEEKFDLSREARGRVLKLKIEAYQELDKPGEALALLDQFLAVADPKDVGPVLRGLFGAMIEDVRDLIKRGKRQQASAKVEHAKALGTRFVQWLENSNLPKKEIEIENVHYDLAELYLAVGDFGQALRIYQEIAGPKPEDVEPGEPLPEDAVEGMARAHEGLGDEAPGPDEAQTHYTRAFELWRVLRNVADLQPQDSWERDYHFLYCMFKLGRKEETRKNLKSLRILSDGPLGGSDPLLQKKFRRLEAEVSR